MKRKVVFILLSLTLILHSCGNKNEIPPTVTSINPTSGGYGTELTITGTGFSSVVTDNIVKIGGINAEVKSASSTTLKVLIPSLTEANLPVIVTTAGGLADAGLFSYVYDVYVAGNEVNSSGFQVVKYWKNGVPVELSDGKSSPYASAIAVSGNNVYVVGIDYQSSYRKIKLWVNRVETNISDAAISVAFDLFLDGNDVYIAGYVNNGSKDIATYWKNGIPVYLTTGSTNAILRAITVSGGDIYAAGYEWNETKPVAKYWKNGVPVALTDGKKSATSRDIVINGNDIYICGVEYENSVETAKFWKNGVVTTLGDGINRSFTVAMAGKENSTYIVGLDNGLGRCWKNGVVTPFTQNESETLPISVFLIDDDVFIAGSLGNNLVTKAAYWKNGNLVLLTNGTYQASANSIFVR